MTSYYRAAVYGGGGVNLGDLTTRRHTAEDGPPEHAVYVDEGCDLAPHCLSCPLVACKYDLPPKRARTLPAEARLADLLATGMALEAAAVVLGVSRRTAYRLKAKMARPLVLRSEA